MTARALAVVCCTTVMSAAPLRSRFTDVPVFQHANVHGVAVATTEHDGGISSVEAELREWAFEGAAAAGDRGERHIERENLTQPASRRVTVERDDILGHLLSPVGPNRSVLMLDSA